MARWIQYAEDGWLDAEDVCSLQIERYDLLLIRMKGTDSYEEYRLRGKFTAYSVAREIGVPNVLGRLHVTRAADS